MEEKIIQCAEAKLHLDAVIIQQGRLVDSKKRLSKQEMLGMVRYGAESVFRSSTSTITDDDIDAILSRSKMKKAEKKKDMMDFKFDYTGNGVQEFNGVDYSKKSKY